MWGDDDGPGPYASIGFRYIKARKDHLCANCLQPIYAGEVYMSFHALLISTGHWVTEALHYETPLGCHTFWYTLYT